MLIVLFLCVIYYNSPYVNIVSLCKKFSALAEFLILSYSSSF